MCKNCTLLLSGPAGVIGRKEAAMWYTGICGNWRNPNGIIRIGGTYDRKRIFEEAQIIANEHGIEVTIVGQIGSAAGLQMKTYIVTPQK